jgi:hypothetical protein
VFDNHLPVAVNTMKARSATAATADKTSSLSAECVGFRLSISIAVEFNHAFAQLSQTRMRHPMRVRSAMVPEQAMQGCVIPFGGGFSARQFLE